MKHEKQGPSAALKRRLDRLEKDAPPAGNLPLMGELRWKGGMGDSPFASLLRGYPVPLKTVYSIEAVGLPEPRMRMGEAGLLRRIRGDKHKPRPRTARDLYERKLLKDFMYHMPVLHSPHRYTYFSGGI